jgi:hypothetical protein
LYDLTREGENMTTKNDYTGEEWELLKEVLFTTATIIIMVSPNQTLGLLQEARTIWKTLDKIGETDQTELVQALLNDSTPPVEVQGEVDTEEISGAEIIEDVLESCGKVAVILEQKATPTESQDYKAQLMAVCKLTAEAAIEPGEGIFGLGGKRINEKEQSALDLIAQALNYK